MNREKVKVRKKEMPNQIVLGWIWFMKDAIEDGLRLFDWYPVCSVQGWVKGGPWDVNII